jgi:hypothetical protein
VEHEYAPWEKRCHALANVLDIHKIISTEEKRRGVESLGSNGGITRRSNHTTLGKLQLMR